MSRRYDEYTDGKFEIYGEMYELIEPENFEGLLKALKVKGALETAISGLMHDEDSSTWCSLLQEQDNYIQEYLNTIGDFDNSHLVGNINYLAKKYNLRIGEIENMLHISAGYISRTARENSPKKLSIDVVWKLAVLFGIDLRALLETDLQIPNSNTDLAAKFIAKALSETESGHIEWICNGGCASELDESFNGSRLITQQDDVTYYHPMYLSNTAKFILDDDIFACENIDLHREVLIVPFKLDNTSKTHYEFIFRHSDDNESSPTFGAYYFTRMFNTASDPFADLDICAEQLYKCIKDREYDTQLSAGAKAIIIQYLNRSGT